MDVTPYRKQNPNERHIKRMLFAIVFFLGVFGFLAWHLYGIQINRHEELLAKAKKRYITSVKERALRGTIRDMNGALIASDEPYYSLTVAPANFPPKVLRVCEHKQFGDPYRCPECLRDPHTIRRAARFFSDQLGISYQQLLQQFSETSKEVSVNTFQNGTRKVERQKRLNQYAVVMREIDYEEGNKLMERMREFIKVNKENCVDKSARVKEDFSRAFNLEVRYRRTYPLGSFLANIIGYVNIETEKAIGQSGLEKSMDMILKPQEGKRIYERRPGGSVIGFHGGVDERKAAVPGSDIYLTISQPIQSIVENELDALVEKWHPKLAYCVVADPKTGNILALAQRPNFNPNNRATFSGSNIQNLMAENIYEPGSTMKPIPISMAIDEGLITANTKFNCENGFWLYGGKPLRDCHPYGILSTQQVVQKSSNVGSAKIALLLGDPRLDQGYKDFGFGQKTNIPLRPESRGIYLPLRSWSKLTPTRIAIGQGIAVTPFQMVRAYCAICNNGWMPQLRIIDRTTEYDGAGNSVTHKFKTPPPKQVYKHPEETSRCMIEMMKTVCIPGGTAKAGAIPGYYTAGKTGTAQKVINGRYSNTKHIGNFVGFAPADTPRIVMLISVDEPKGCSYGGIVAAPMFATAGERILKYLQVPPDYEIGSEADPMPDRRAKIARMRRDGKLKPDEIPEIPMVDVQVPFPDAPIEDPDAIFAPVDREKPRVISIDATFDENDLTFIREVDSSVRHSVESARTGMHP